MAFTLTEAERKVLQCLADNSDAWLAFYNHEVIAAAGDIDTAKDICKGLRRRKLLETDGGRGTHTGYAINDKGREALAQPAMENVSETPPGPPAAPRPAGHRPIG